MNIEPILSEPLWMAIRNNFENRNYSGAVLDGFYFLSELLREKSGCDGDGIALVGQALGGPAPKIRLNKLQSESEINVQRGTEMLLRGLYQSVRNPRSHEKTTDTAIDAEIILLFIGYLVKQLDSAKAQFSRNEFVKRAIDKNFVPQARYASLLVSEIPPKYRVEVFLDVFRAKNEGTADGLKYFFDALLDSMNEDEKHQTYAIVSEELLTVDEDATIRLIIRALGNRVWKYLTEVSRLRIEHKIIRELTSGKFDLRTSKCTSGALATWGHLVFADFLSQQDLLSAIMTKTEHGGPSDLEYLYRLIYPKLPLCFPTMPDLIVEGLITSLAQGTSQTKIALSEDRVWSKKDWPESLQTAFDNFKPIEFSEDDIPF